MKQEKKSVKEWVQEHKKGLIMFGVGVCVSITAIYLHQRGANSEDMLLKPKKGRDNVDTLPDLIPDFTCPDVLTPNPQVDLPVSAADLSTIDLANIVTYKQWVDEHKMKLPDNKYASAEKLEYAKTLGIDLEDHETIRKAHERMRTKAS